METYAGARKRGLGFGGVAVVAAAAALVGGCKGTETNLGPDAARPEVLDLQASGYQNVAPSPAPQPENELSNTAVPLPEGSAVPTPAAESPRTPTAAASPDAGASPATPAAADGGPQRYTVEPGDTLWKISTRFYGTGKFYPRILAANPGLRESALPVGKQIVIPPG